MGTALAQLGGWAPKVRPLWPQRPKILRQGSVSDHWAFDGEATSILVDDDQKERPGGLEFAHHSRKAGYYGPRRYEARSC